MPFLDYFQRLRTRIQVRGFMGLLKSWFSTAVVLTVRGIKWYVIETFLVLYAWVYERNMYKAELVSAFFTSLILSAVVALADQSLNVGQFTVVWGSMWFLLFAPSYYVWRTVAFALRSLMNAYSNIANRYDNKKKPAEELIDHSTIECDDEDTEPFDTINDEFRDDQYDLDEMSS